MRYRSITFVSISLLISILAAGFEESRPSAHFESIGPFGGDVRALLIDAQRPDIVYLGTSNGKIYKSLDAGKSWAPLYPGIGHKELVVDTLVQHPSEHDHIYAGAWDLRSEGGGLYESRDAGLTWKQMHLPRASAAVRGFDICKTDPSRMIAGTLAGVYVSADGGNRWSQVGGSEFLKTESVAIDPHNSRFLYVGTWRLGYRSNDFGKTWTRVDKGMPLDSDVFSISLSPGNPEIMYASACSGVYRSVNRASSWSRLKILPDRFVIRAQIVYIDPVNDHRVYTGTTEGLFVSDNDGQTWMRLTSPDTVVNAIQIDPGNNRRLLIGTEYQGVLLSEDGGRTWQESNSGFVRQQISWIIPEPQASGQFLSGALSGGGGLYSYNKQDRSWKVTQIEPGMRILSFLILPNDRGRLAGTSQGLYWQTSDSSSWKKLNGSIARRTIYSLEMDSSSPVIYAGTDQGIYRTSLAAMDFRVPPGYRFSPQTWCIVAPKTNPGIIYAGTSLGLLRSWDKGTTWNVISAFGLPERVSIGIVAVSPSAKDHLFAGTSIGLFESKNGGIHWKQVGEGMLSLNISSLIFLDSSGANLLAADKTSGGIFLSMDSGLTWAKLSSPMYESPVNCLMADPERSSIIYIGTQSDGVYQLDLQGKKQDAEHRKQR
jgi:photosystem II stability/assembly factor-like uncharacterized protein